MSAQGKIWNRITNSELLDNTGISAQCSTQWEAWQDNMYDDMCDKFKATLSEAQADAFQNVVNIASMVAYDLHNKGIAEGFMIARELRVLLDNPAAAMIQGELLLNSPYEVNKCEIERLRAYFKELHFANI